MKLNVQKIPLEFIQSIPRGFHLTKKDGNNFLLVESLFCPNGHNLLVDSVRIHHEASIKLKVTINETSGIIFIDAFWGSHCKLFSFIPSTLCEINYVDAYCPFCDISLMEKYTCSQAACDSEKGILLHLPGTKNSIHVCAKLDCPGHILDITNMPSEIIESVSRMNYFGTGSDDLFGGI